MFIGYAVDQGFVDQVRPCGASRAPSRLKGSAAVVSYPVAVFEGRYCCQYALIKGSLGGPIEGMDNPGDQASAPQNALILLCLIPLG